MKVGYIPVALGELQKAIRTVAYRITGWKYRTAVYHAPGAYEYTSDWQAVGAGDTWGKGDITGFFVHPGIDIPTVSPEKQIGLELAVEGEGVLKINDKYYHGIDRYHNFIPLLGAYGSNTHLKLEMEIAGRMNINDPKSSIDKQVFVFHDTRVTVIDKAAEALWFDLQMGWEAANVTKQDDVKLALHNALYRAVVELDFRDIQSPAFSASVIRASKTYHRLLSDIDFGKLGGRLHLMGHSHIDVAWKWQLKETVRKCSRTFSTALTLMEEFPQFQFTCSQVQLYEYTKRHYPELYARIKSRVAAGQWEPTGSTWVEMDCNIPSGEAFVRQFLYGKRFFQGEFGVETRVLWLPDVFGYSAALPQIMKRAGVDYFLTNKLRWNDTNVFPHSLFQWEGIDGTRVLAHIPPSRSYNGTTDAKQMSDQWSNFSPKHLVRDVAYSYGHGDGGGGVTRDMIKRAARVENMPGFPQCSLDTSHNYFAGVAPIMSQLPVWQGELYFEYHRGTYTTQAKTKRYNRKAEILYREIELWSSLAKQKVGSNYPLQTLHDGWKTILLNQFHDIIPGSSTADVYVDSAEQYEAIFAAGNRALQSSVGAIAQGVNTGRVSDALIVFNSRSWTSTDIAEAILPTELVDAACWVVDTDGKAMPTQKVRTANDTRLVFLAQDVPAMGYKTFFVEKGPGATAPQLKAIQSTDAFSNGQLHAVQTARYRLCFANDGRLQGIYDLENQRPVVSETETANDWQLFEDRPRNYPAWDIEAYYQDKPLGTETVRNLEIVENGPVFALIRCTKEIGKARFTQDIVLYAHSRRIDFRTYGEWQEKEALLKVAFPVQVRSGYATYEIAYGAVERSTHENTSWEEAQFEVSGHKWADLSEGNYGVSLLNDCKYGYDIRDSRMRLTLLRAPIAPDPHADEGYHEFTYALYPHQGTWRSGGTVKEAYSLNQPFTVEKINAHAGAGAGAHVGANVGAGTLPPEQSMVTSSAENAIVEVVKAAEDDTNALIVRVFEAYGQRGQVRLTFAHPVATAVECDLLERNVQPVRYTGSDLHFDIKPYEIRTFKLTLA